MLKNVVVFLLLCAAVRMTIEILPDIFYLNTTSSLPKGLYMKIPSARCRHGDYIVYEPTDDIKKIIKINKWGDGNKDFIKQVGGTAGDKYSVDADTLTFEINGKYIGQVYEKDNAGNELPKLRGNFEVPKGYVLPIATGARSFDGRYSGVIPETQIKAHVVPIFIF